MKVNNSKKTLYLPLIRAMTIQTIENSENVFKLTEKNLVHELLLVILDSEL